ncbi:MAG TPA: BON domain-containing protein [Ideonella sp.]|jgi:osmotically-inducible protein OsmY|nr:BON domain-containing protein [Ideonella sp.]
MLARTSLIALATALLALVGTPGCTVTRGQSTVGEYVDDAAITARVKARWVESHDVDAAVIHVQTLNGEVLVSGFAKDAKEKAEAERLARETPGVKRVRSEIVIRQ